MGAFIKTHFGVKIIIFYGQVNWDVHGVDSCDNRWHTLMESLFCITSIDFFFFFPVCYTGILYIKK